MALAIGVALAFRLAALDARPMHHDEANQAIRFGQLLETGEYRYEAADHHGPTLYYLTLPAAWLRRQQTTASLDERTLRLVPAAFGAGLLLLLLPLVRGAGRSAVVVSAALLAVAPPLTYYGRFYIQETLLLFFTTGFLVATGRYALEGGWGAALRAGAFAGLALATKETAALLIPAALAGCAAARRWGRPVSRDPQAGSAGAGERTLATAHAWAAAAIALAIAGLFYSSFFTNLQGILEPFRAAGIYAGRGLNPDAHRGPWYYYFRLLYQGPGGNMAGIDVALLLGVISGMIVAVGRKAAAGTAFWVRCLLVYALIVTVVYSALPYKTPWNVLPLYAGWVIVAGIGLAQLLEHGCPRAGRILLAAALVVLCGAMAVQSWRASFRYPADPRNPYAYVHTSPDVVRLAGRVKALSALHRDFESMLVAVVAGPYEQWPLPWYLRRMNRVGYWRSAEAAGPALALAPVIVASPQYAEKVAAALGERYQAEYYGLRPDVIMSVFIERSLWDRFIESVSK